MYKVVLLPIAKWDLQEAAKWYAKQKKDLGLRFLHSVRQRITEIKTNSEFFSVKYADIHTANVKGFPYLIHFNINDTANIILIVAVLHTSRNPDLWER